MSDSEALRERARDLSLSASACRERLLAQAAAAARLRSQVEALRKNLAAPRPAARARTEAASGSARTAATSLRAAAPYAMIVVAAIGFEFARSPRAAAPPPLDGLIRPAVSVSPLGPAAHAPGTPVAFDEDDRGAEALALVHSWKLPGDEETLHERLGDDEGMPHARPAWSAHRSGANAYLVIYQRDENFAAYQFEADLETKTVTPSPGTEAALLAPVLAFSE